MASAVMEGEVTVWFPVCLGAPFLPLVVTATKAQGSARLGEA